MSTIKCDCCSKDKSSEEYLELSIGWIEFWGMICRECREENSNKEI